MTYRLLIVPILCFFNLLNSTCPCQFAKNKPIQQQQQTRNTTNQEEFYKAVLNKNESKIKELLEQHVIFDIEGNLVNLIGKTTILDLIKQNNLVVKNSIIWFINKLNTQTLNPTQWYNSYVSQLSTNEKRALTQILHLKIENFTKATETNLLIQTPNIKTAYEKAVEFALNYKKMSILQYGNQQIENKVWLTHFYNRTI